MKPIKTRKQLCNHLYGRDHLNVVEYRERTEEGYVPDRGRSPFGVALPSWRHEQETRTVNEIIEPDGVRNAEYQEWFDQCAFQDDQGRLVSSYLSPPSRAHHQGHPTSRELRERYVLHRTLRINEYCGPGPDCDSSNYEPEPPDDPCMGMYNPTIPDQELGSVARYEKSVFLKSDRGQNHRFFLKKLEGVQKNRVKTQRQLLAEIAYIERYQ
jgi:hypothetical protein